MTLFKFKAKKADGEIYEGEKDALDKFALYRDLKTTGDIVLSAKETKTGRTFGLDFGFIGGLFLRVSARDKILMARNLGSMLKAGLSLSRSFSIMERQTKKKGLKAIFKRLNEEISQGKSLSESLKIYPNVFSSLFISMVKSGEESGSLSDSLKTVSDQMDRMYSLKKKVRGALIYPAIILVLMVVIAIVMLIYVVPSISAIFEDIDAELPMNTKILIFMSDSFVNHGIVWGIGIFAVISLIYFFMRTDLGKKFFDGLYLKLPIIGNLVRETNSARTARTLASLLNAGVDVIEAIQITKEVVQNVFFKQVLDKAGELIKKGEPMNTVFAENSHLYPIFVGEMISIGEETGQLTTMLSNVAVYYEDEVDQKTKNLSTIIEPVLMVLVGLGVAFFALSVLGPIYSLADKFSI